MGEPVKKVTLSFIQHVFIQQCFNEPPAPHKKKPTKINTNKTQWLGHVSRGPGSGAWKLTITGEPGRSS